MSDTSLPFTSHFITTTHAPITLCIILYYNTHTHTHTHTHTNSNTVHTYTHVHMYSPWTHTHARTHTHKCRHTQAIPQISHTHTHVRTDTHTKLCTCMEILKNHIIHKESQKSSKVNGTLEKNLKVDTIKSFNYHNSNFLS